MFQAVESHKSASKMYKVWFLSIFHQLIFSGQGICCPEVFSKTRQFNCNIFSYFIKNLWSIRTLQKIKVYQDKLQFFKVENARLSHLHLRSQ